MPRSVESKAVLYTPQITACKRIDPSLVVRNGHRSPREQTGCPSGKCYMRTFTILVFDHQYYMAKVRRRSVLATMAAMGVGSLAGVSSGSETSSQDSVHPSGGDGEIVGIEVIDLETGARSYYEDWDDFEEAALPDGQYEVVEVVATAESVEERHYDGATGTQATTSSTGIDLRVLIESETSYDVLDPDGTVRVWIGAVDTADGLDRGPVPDHDVEVMLEYQDDDWEWHEIESTTATTNDGGFVIVEFDLAESDHTEYRISVSSQETDASATEEFDAGPYTRVPFHWTGMTPGEETDIGIFSAVGGIPETDVTREIEVSGPEGTDTFDIEIEDGGIGWLSFAPSEPGDYWFDSPESPTFSRSIGAADLKALAPYFQVRDQYYDDEPETFRWGAYLIEEREPVADKELTVTVLEDTWEDDPEEITTASATTNDFGQFTIDIPRPDDPDMDYEIDIETAEGDPVFLFGDGIWTDAIPPEAPVDGETIVDLDIYFETEEFQTWPGDEGTLVVELTEDGAPIPNQPVTIWYSHTFNRLPMGKVEAMTDDDGLIEQEFTVPHQVPDGERFYIEAVTELDGDTYTDDTSISIERYDIEYTDWGLEPGETNEIPVSVYDRVADEPVEGMNITMFGNRNHVDTETFDADTTQTDENGEGQISLAVPEDVTNDIMVNALTPYRSTSISSGSLADPITPDITVEPELPARGETITVSYETDSDAAVTAFALFPSRESADLEILDEGEETTFTVPEYLQPGGTGYLELLLLGADGEAAEVWEFISIAEELRASFAYTPAEPITNDTVTFEDTSSAGPDAPIESRAWDLTGDGETDVEGEEVTHTYEEAGTYEVTLTITDEDGETDSVTEAIKIGEPDSPLTEYTNQEDVVDTGGLRDGVDDWRSGEIETATLRDLVEYWRSGEPVGS